MSTVVMNSAGEIEQLLTGKAPDRPEVIADNAKKADKAASVENKGPKEVEKEVKATPAIAVTENSDDDVEGEDGLTPRQKREYTAAMLKTIGKKHARLKDAEEFAAAQYNERTLAERRAAAAEEELAKLRGQQKPVETKKPERSEFESDAAYQDALVEYRVKEQLTKEKQRQAEEQEQQRQADIIKAATDRLKAAAELVPDFHEVTEESDMRVPGHIAAYMRESDLFAELGYHLAKNPQVLEKLAKLSPVRALVEVVKIESTLKPFSETYKSTEKTNGTQPSPSDGAKTPSPETGSSQSAVPSQKSRAPVIKPLGSDSVSQVDKEPREMNTREMIEDWKKRNRSNIGLRKRH